MLVGFLLCMEALNFSLKDESMGRGKVCPFSQISTSFLIFSYNVIKVCVSGNSRNEQYVPAAEMLSKIYEAKSWSCEISKLRALRSKWLSKAYLLISGSRLYNVVHQDWKKFFYSIDTCSICTIRCRAVYGLSSSLGLYHPFSSYRVYDVKYAQFVRPRGLFEMGE